MTAIFTTITAFMRRLKELFMKASRFIMNTDYATPQNDTDFTISVNIPASFTVPRTQSKEFKASYSLPGSASRAYRCYITSTAFNYGITGCNNGSIQFGSRYLEFTVSRTKDKYELCVFVLPDPNDRTFSGTAQTITAHVQTFIDPFAVEL